MQLNYNFNFVPQDSRLLILVNQWIQRYRIYKQKNMYKKSNSDQNSMLLHCTNKQFNINIIFLSWRVISIIMNFLLTYLQINCVIILEQFAELKNALSYNTYLH